MSYDVLNNLGTDELLQKINAFKNISVDKADYGRLCKELLTTMNFILVTAIDLTNKNSEFLYRIRNVPLSKDNFPILFHKTSDLWYRHPKDVEADQRVNRAGTSMLYCSLDKITPIIECDLKEKEWFALIAYTIKENETLHVSVIDRNIPLPEGLSDSGKINYRIINDFLVSEFTKPVGSGSEFLYKMSNAIFINLLDLPFCDGVIYPSVDGKGNGRNVALKTESADRALEISSLSIGRLNKWEKGSFECFEFCRANRIEQDNIVYEIPIA